MLTADGLRLGDRLGAGGEADVFAVEGRPGLAAKVYRQPSQGRTDKLRLMLADPPAAATDGGHVSIAWPVELVPGPTPGAPVAGFLMPRVDLTRAAPLFELYNPSLRVRRAPGFSYRYLVRTARNLASCVAAIHRAGHAVGDLNESNVLVDRRALVVVVDCDSMQVTDPSTGFVHRSTVGKPEFLAPELQGADLATTDRSPASDAFALGVLVHQILREGLHPHTGVWRGRGAPPEIGERIARGWVARPVGRSMLAATFGWLQGSPVVAPPHAVERRALPSHVRSMLRRSVGRRRAARPSAADWAEALDRLERSLTTCRRSPHHEFAGRRCPWCHRIDRGLPDPFPGPGGRSGLERRRPPLLRRARRRSGIALSRAGGRVSVAVLRTFGTALPATRVPAVAATLALAGWTFPVVAPVFVAVMVVPLILAVVTPTLRVGGEIGVGLARALTLAAGLAPLGVGVADLGSVATIDVVAAVSALTTSLHAILHPLSSPAWERARRRLRIVPWWLCLLAWAAAVAAATIGNPVRVGLW